MRGPFDEVVRRQELEDKRLAKEMRKYSGHCIFYIVSLYILYMCDMYSINRDAYKYKYVISYLND